MMVSPGLAALIAAWMVVNEPLSSTSRNVLTPAITRSIPLSVSTSAPSVTVKFVPLKPTTAAAL